MSSLDSHSTAASVSSHEECGRLCDDETAITEITFLPDGRLCLFGASRELLELLGSLNLGDAALDIRLAASRRATTDSSNEPLTLTLSPQSRGEGDKTGLTAHHD